MQTTRFQLGDLIEELQSLVRDHAPLVVLAVALIGAIYAALDFAEARNSLTAISLVVSVYGQRHFVERLLADRIPMSAHHNRYGAILLSCLLGGFGILVGFVLFVVPGLFLLAAWSASTPFIMVEDMGAVAALGASWRATAGSRLAIMLVFVVYGVALIGGSGLIVVLLDRIGAAGSAFEIVVTNLIAGLFVTAGWLVGTAVYRLAVPMSSGFETVFA